MATRDRFSRGVLIDRGANGSALMSVLYPLLWFWCMQDPIGEFIAIFNQVAYHGTGHSILSSTHIVTFGHKLMIELFALEAANYREPWRLFHVTLPSLTSMRTPLFGIFWQGMGNTSVSTLRRTHVHPIISTSWCWWLGTYCQYQQCQSWHTTVSSIRQL